LILGLLLFFIPPFIGFKRIWRSILKPDISLLFYTSFISGFYFYSCFDFPLKRIEHNVLQFMLFAFLLHKSVTKTVDDDSKEPIHSKNPKTQNNLILRIKSLRLCVFAIKEKTAPKYANTENLIIILFLFFTAFIGLSRLSGEYYTLKMFRYERNNDEKVIRNCQKAENFFYKITPNTLPVAWFEGVAWYRKGDVNSAIPCFERALKSTPFEVRVLNDYGISLFTMNHKNEAKSVLLHAFDIDPYFDDAKFNLGAIYYLTGQADSARYYINRCRDCQKKREFLEEMNKVAR
jgi:tetratricopeptide (TPR) repeat protein